MPPSIASIFELPAKQRRYWIGTGLAVGAGLLLFGIPLLARTVQFDSLANHTRGTITSSRLEIKRPGLRENYNCIFAVEFWTRSEQLITIQAHTDWFMAWSKPSARDHCQGMQYQSVDVAYDPTNPSDVVLRIGPHYLRRPAVFTLPIIGALLTTYFTLALIRPGFTRKNRTESEEK